MNQRRHKRARQALQQEAIAWRMNWPEDRDLDSYDDGYDEYGEYDDQWACTRCGGEGRIESDDPFWDDADEFGEIECWACSGTGERQHQTIF